MYRSDFIALGKSQKGKKYILGTPSPYNKPNPTAFDCSGLCIWLFNKAGCKHPDTTANGLYHESKTVSSYATGDMVFLVDSKDHAYHTAMLLYPTTSGDWAIVEARGHVAGVVLTTLSYWRKRAGFRGPRRWSGFTLQRDPVKFSIAHASQKSPRFGGLPSDSPVRAAGVDKLLTDDHPCSIISVTETDLRMRQTINAKLGKHWDRFVQWPDRTVGFFVNTRIWEPRGVRTHVGYGDSYHGAVRAILRHLVTNVELQLIVHHGRAAETAGSHPDLTKALTLDQGAARALFTGDLAINLSGLTVPNFRLDSPVSPATYEGGGTPDGVFSRGLSVVNAASYGQPWSDHRAVRVTYSL